MIPEAIIGSITSIILGSLWLAKAITTKMLDKEAAEEKALRDEEEAVRTALLPKPKETVYSFVPVDGGRCHLCGAGASCLARVYENGYLRRSCSNCGGKYLMELATKGKE